MVPVKESNTEVLVCGAGSAGVSAAVAASRLGASVRLIDQNGFFGGTLVSGITGGFCGIYEAKKDPEEKTELTLGGVGKEILDRMQQIDGLSDMCVSRMFNTRRYDSCLLQIVYDNLVVGAGVSSLLHSTIIDAEAQDGNIQFVEISNKSGRERIYPQIVIDATGDADILFMTGGKYRKELSQLQPASFNFRVAGVDTSYPIPNLHELEEKIKIIKMQEGGLEFSREDPMFLQASKFERETVCCFNRISLDATDAKALTEAEIQGRSEVLPVLEFIKKHFPAFKNAYLSGLPSHIGVRETRVIDGLETLSRDDVVNGKRRKDGIGRCGWPVEMHINGQTKAKLVPVSGNQRYYDIPFGVMIPVGYKNLLVTGRAASADREANASSRVFGPCSVMGQAAGTAAFLCIRQNYNAIENLNVSLLRNILTDNGVLI